jgi:hypothetical protein
MPSGLPVNVSGGFVSPTTGPRIGDGGFEPGTEAGVDRNREPHGCSTLQRRRSPSRDLPAAIEAGRVEAEHTWAMKAWRIILILSAAQLILVLDTTVMNVSISNVADLNTSVPSSRSPPTCW